MSAFNSAVCFLVNKVPQNFVSPKMHFEASADRSDTWKNCKVKGGHYSESIMWDITVQVFPPHSTIFLDVINILCFVMFSLTSR